MTTLTRSSGPDCPRCGCNGAALVEAGVHGARPWARFDCPFCRHSWTLGSRPVEGRVVNGVKYNTTRCVCPHCSAKNPPVVNTSGRVRYHSCTACGQPFKSVEE